MYIHSVDSVATVIYDGCLIFFLFFILFVVFLLLFGFVSAMIMSRIFYYSNAHIFVCIRLLLMLAAHFMLTSSIEMCWYLVCRYLYVLYFLKFKCNVRVRMSLLRCVCLKYTSENAVQLKLLLLRGTFLIWRTTNARESYDIYVFKGPDIRIEIGIGIEVGASASVVLYSLYAYLFVFRLIFVMCLTDISLVEKKIR